MPQPKRTIGSSALRKGRKSIKHQRYLLTAVAYDREPLFLKSKAAHTILKCLHNLDKDNRIVLDLAVVMPDHVHFMAQLISGSLAQLMHSLKSFSANQINIALNRNRKVWQSQYYDHAVREGEFEKLAYYCLNNPARKGLVTTFRDYPFWYCRWDI